VVRCPGVDWTRRPPTLDDDGIDLARAVRRWTRRRPCAAPFALHFLVRLIRRVDL
jgi:hypothetical protein